MSYMTDIARDSSDRPEIPSFIASAMLPAARVVKDIPEQDYIDGHMMPRGVCTILATAGGSGKTTASLSAALKSSLDGSFDLFGSRRHSPAAAVYRDLWRGDNTNNHAQDCA